MTPKGYNQISAFLFLVISATHALRLIYGASVIVNGLMMPLWMSWAGLVVGLVLAYYGIRLSRDERKKRR